MKIWPFWRFWYFTGQQRKGLLLIVAIFCFTLILRKPLQHWAYNRHAAELKLASEQKWSQIEQRRQAYAEQQKTETEKAKEAATKWMKEQSKPVSKAKAVLKPIDINQSVAEDWQQFYGIGTVLSERIINYRTALGGFHKVEQVGEVFGISEEVFDKMRDQLNYSLYTLQTIDVNAATEAELKAHPYISETLAKQIVSQREQSGLYSGVHELLRLQAMNEKTYIKVLPYLKAEQHD